MACANEETQVFTVVCMCSYLKWLPSTNKKSLAQKNGLTTANKAYNTTKLNINTNRIF